MRVRTVPFSSVAADIEEVSKLRDDSHPSARSKRFNTGQHKRLEILPVVAERIAFRHEAPPFDPYDYTLWQPLVARSQRLQASDSFVGRVPDFMWQDLMRCHSTWIATGKIDQRIADEVVETWVSTKPGKEIAAHFDGNKKWFVRLAQMSPKDSPLGGSLPCTTLAEVVIKICSSMRAYGCLERERDAARAHGKDVNIKIAINAWDGGMDPMREFRVFVPPPGARLSEEMKISAISQYRWWTPFVSPYPDSDFAATASKVLCEAEKIFEEILAFVKTELGEEIGKSLWKYGFSFDIIVKEGGQVQLVELNPFGAMSGCGACLFQWITDGKVLYGLDEAEFAITAEENTNTKTHDE